MAWPAGTPGTSNQRQGQEAMALGAFRAGVSTVAAAGAGAAAVERLAEASSRAGAKQQ